MNRIFGARNSTRLCTLFVALAAMSAIACTSVEHGPTAGDLQRPPNPEVNYDDWAASATPRSDRAGEPAGGQNDSTTANWNETKIRRISGGEPIYDQTWFGGECDLVATFMFDVSWEGIPFRVRMLMSSGSQQFDHAAKRALGGWYYGHKRTEESSNFRKNLLARFATTNRECKRD